MRGFAVDKEVLVYDPTKHVLGHTYWDKAWMHWENGRRPIKFYLYLDENEKVSVVKVDARRSSYMKNFGGCYSQVFFTEGYSTEVPHTRLFLSMERVNQMKEILWKRRNAADDREIVI